jgi:hypothetical protein
MTEWITFDACRLKAELQTLYKRFFIVSGHRNATC